MTDKKQVSEGVLIRINLSDDINLHIMQRQLAEKPVTGLKPTKKSIVEKMLRAGFEALNKSK